MTITWNRPDVSAAHGSTHIIYIHSYIPTHIQTYIHTNLHSILTYNILNYIHTCILRYILTYLHSYKHMFTYILTYLHTSCITYIAPSKVSGRNVSETSVSPVAPVSGCLAPQRVAELRVGDEAVAGAWSRRGRKRKETQMAPLCWN